jgi:shikimate dehydrogenase
MTDRYAVVGNPIAQSKSPIIHSLFAEATGESLTYERVLAPIDAFAATIDRLRNEGFRGVNITAPFKVEAFEYASSRAPGAEQAGAANALRFEGNHVLAENFDGVGLVRDVQTNLDCSLLNKRVLVLGAGGATRGALQPIIAARPALIVIANRDLDKARKLVTDVAANSAIDVCDYAALNHAEFDVVFNATSAGLFADCPPVSTAVFSQCELAYDLTYGKGLTPFLQLAQSGGAKRVADGVGMLVEQAAEAFHWWRDVRPHTRAAIDAITVPLA